MSSETITWNKEKENSKELPKRGRGTFTMENGIKVNFNNSIYLLGHYNAADLSMLFD
jgi:hypothetical protein